MAPIIEVSDETLMVLNPEVYTRRDDLEKASSDKEHFVYVPSMKLWVAKERSLHGKNWFEAHRELQSQGSRMITMPEFVEFLKYAGNEHPKIYEKITAIRSPWRAEWIDADFRKLHMNSQHVYDKNENLVPQYSEPLESETLMGDRTPGVSLESWLANPTKQGMPRKDVEKGSLYYWCPRQDNNSVAGFGAGGEWRNLDCDGGPSNGDSYLGVRAVKRE